MYESARGLDSSARAAPARSTKHKSDALPIAGRARGLRGNYFLAAAEEAAFDADAAAADDAEDDAAEAFAAAAKSFECEDIFVIADIAPSLLAKADSAASACEFAESAWNAAECAAIAAKTESPPPAFIAADMLAFEAADMFALARALFAADMLAMEAAAMFWLDCAAMLAFDAADRS